MTLPIPTDKHQEKAISDIKDHGLHILGIFDPDGVDPNFAYSIGMKHSYQHADIIVFGLSPDVAQSIINLVADKVKDGFIFENGDSSLEILNGFECVFKLVSKKYYKDYFGWNLWLNQGDDFSVLQLFWPNPEGDFPWEEGAHQDFKSSQPILTL